MLCDPRKPAASSPPCAALGAGRPHLQRLPACLPNPRSPHARPCAARRTVVLGSLKSLPTPWSLLGHSCAALQVHHSFSTLCASPQLYCRARPWFHIAIYDVESLEVRGTHTGVHTATPAPHLNPLTTCVSCDLPCRRWAAATGCSSPWSASQSRPRHKWDVVRCVCTALAFRICMIQLHMRCAAGAFDRS
jgi:hypothetical protein